MTTLDAEQAAYVRTLFLERIAHEMRGPLAVVDGAIQELAWALGEEAQSHRPLFEMMRRGIRRLVRTADRLQQTGECERDDLSLVHHACDLCDLVRGSVDQAALNEGRSAVHIELRLPDEPCYCDVDERWMSIAMYELASNAIRHASERVTVSLDRREGAFEVRFSDDSRSAREFAPMRFRPPAEGRGLGLALAIVRDVLSAHGGDLMIERNASDGAAGALQGTRVSVRIPTAQREVPALGAAQ